MKTVILGITFTLLLNVAQGQDERDFIQVDEGLVYRKLAALEEGKHNVKNVGKAIDLLSFNLHRHSAKSIEQGIPAIGYILKSYDTDVVPLLLDYAFSVDNVYLKRRAVYCIEQLQEQDIQSYLKERFGEDVSGEKIKDLLNASQYDLLMKAKALSKEGRHSEGAQLLYEYKDFFFKQMSDVLMDLDVPDS